jgi:16S rRNA (adenine1518-N6/adenine1519-N6)-dimethyltransferase
MNDHYQHKARKRFGQNFLTDTHVIRKIIAAVNPAKTDNVVEIGPGQGAITGPLLEHCTRLQAVELDRDLAAMLERKFAGHGGFILHQGDALDFDFSTLAAEGPLRVVGNLPYNISTPLLFRLLEFFPLIKDMHFMLQKEVVERITASPGSKEYGRLSVILQYYCHVDYLFTVPPGAFFPAPKVESAIARLTPRKPEELRAGNEAFFRNLVKIAFQQRRKTLRNTLKQLPGDLDLSAVTLDLTRRPETLSVAEFVELAKQLDCPP